MDEYSITFARSARKELEALDAMIVARVFRVIESLAREPRPRSCRKLRGEKNLWRVRIGDYRVIYVINDDDRIVDIVAIRHRRDAYE